MKMFYAFVWFCLYFDRRVGVFGVEMNEITVMEGDVVTLPTGVREDCEMFWMFGPKRTLIAKVNQPKGDFRTYESPDEGVGGRLGLDYDTGSLTIANIATKHAGDYHLQMSCNMGFSSKTFKVVVCARLPVPVISRDCSSSSSSWCSLVCSVEVVSHVTLSWFRGNHVISNISSSDLSIGLSLPLELQRVDDSYRCVVHNPIRNSTQHLENVAQLCQPCPAPLPVPVISSNSSDCSSSSSSSSWCSLVCSVENVSHVTLSWFRGNRSLSSISASDLSISLSLPLEVEHQDKNTYSCEIRNPIRSHTTRLENISQICQPCTGRVHCCGFTETVLRLVGSALIGGAMIAILVYDVRARRSYQKKEQQTLEQTDEYDDVATGH